MSRLAGLTASRGARVGVIAVLGMGSAVAADAATGRVRTGGENCSDRRTTRGEGPQQFSEFIRFMR